MKTPLVVALAIAALAGAAIWIFQPDPPPDDLARPAIEDLKARYAKVGRTEGKDWSVGAVKLLQKSDDRFVARIDVQGFERRRYYVEMKREGGAWKVGRDLDLDFEAFLKAEDAKVKQRLGQALVDRFQAVVEYRIVEARLRVDDDEQGIVAVLDWIYQERGGRGRYLEEFRFENGAWVSPGAGRMYDLPGGAPRR